MIDEALLTAPVVALFAAVHIFGRRLSFLRSTPRSVWLSFAGGTSLSYAFLHLLPEMGHWAEMSRDTAALGGGAGDLLLYIFALAGLIAFYGLDRLAQGEAKRGAEGDRPTAGTFWVHLGAYTIYSALIGYLLVHGEDQTLQGLVLYAVALALHFLVNDHALRELHGDLYESPGRWILAAAPPVGWALGLAVELPALAVAAMFGTLSGGILLNVLKEELPKERESRFSALLLGAVLFSALLLFSR